MPFPLEISSLEQGIELKNGSLLLTGNYNRETGSVGDFKPKPPVSIPHASWDTETTRSSYIALYDKNEDRKWIIDLYDDFNISSSRVFLQPDGSSKIVGSLRMDKKIGDIPLKGIDADSAYIAEISPSGELVSASAININRYYPYSINFAADNSYYIPDNNYDGSLFNPDPTYLSKYNDMHQLQWQKSYRSLGIRHGFFNDDEHYDTNAPFTLKDNSLTFVAINNTTSKQQIMRVSRNGTLEWILEADSNIDSISPSIDGGAIFLRDSSTEEDKELLTKTDSSGNIEWTSTFSRDGRDGEVEIEQKPNGKIVIAGMFEGQAIFSPGLKLLSDDGGADGASFIAQLDNNGNFINAQKLGSEGDGWEIIDALTTLSNNNLILRKSSSLIKLDDNLNDITGIDDNLTPIKPGKQINNNLHKPNKFTRRLADKITNFNPTSDTLEIDIDTFGIQNTATFAAGKSKKVVKKQLAKLDIDFLYDQKKGGLYFNENGADKGFGDGGIIALLKGAPDLTSDDLEFI